MWKEIFLSMYNNKYYLHKTKDFSIFFLKLHNYRTVQNSSVQNSSVQNSSDKHLGVCHILKLEANKAAGF